MSDERSGATGGSTSGSAFWPSFRYDIAMLLDITIERLDHLAKITRDAAGEHLQFGGTVVLSAVHEGQPAVRESVAKFDDQSERAEIVADDSLHLAFDPAADAGRS